MKKIGKKTCSDNGKTTIIVGKTENGKCFKDTFAFKRGNGICYMSEGQYTAYMEKIGKGCSYTEEELVSRGLAETRKTIFSQIEDEIAFCNPLSDNIIGADNDSFDKIDDDFFKCDYIEEFIDYISEKVFFNADWKYLSSYLDAMDFIEEYISFCDERGYECELDY